MTTHLSALIAPLNTNNSDNTNIFLAHGSHSIFFWTRITRITRIFFCTRIALCILLNTNYADNTNIFIWHTDLTDLCSRRGAHMGNTRFLNTDVTLSFFWTRDSPKAHWPQGGNNADNTNIICTRRRGAQFWLLNVECWIVAAGRNVELTNDEFRCSHKMFWTRDFWTRMSLCIFWTRITRMTRIFFWHTDLTDLCSRRGAHSFLNTRFAVGPLTEGRYLRG